MNKTSKPRRSSLLPWGASAVFALAALEEKDE
jgi:hypothetical protein